MDSRSFVNLGTQQAKWPPLCFVQVFERQAGEAFLAWPDKRRRRILE
jgi:hypothetical protein